MLPNRRVIRARDYPLRHFGHGVRVGGTERENETDRYEWTSRRERTGGISKELLFETTLFPALFPGRLSVTTWRTIRFPCSCRTRAARCFLRGPPFVAWANVFYSIKQTRYLVGKLVRTQRCDVEVPREPRASDIPADIQSLTSHFASRIECSAIPLPFSIFSLFFPPLPVRSRSRPIETVGRGFINAMEHGAV